MNIGIVGWRGMVGSVLMSRMHEENDFDLGNFTFFTTSNKGGEGPEIKGQKTILEDAKDLTSLSKQDVIITCQGGGYTSEIYSELRKTWKGVWIDAASTLRMDDQAVIILDPVNGDKIESAYKKGIRTFVGGNCTVSLMLMGLGGLFKQNWVSWVSSMTYQAASGAGAANMKEIVAQAGFISEKVSLADTALKMESDVNKYLASDEFPKDQFGYPLAYSLLPYIDSEVELGQSREEWKGFVETNKILETSNPIPVDGICVRVSSLRCHSQAFTIKLNSDVPMDEIEEVIASANDWVELVSNSKPETLEKLTPAKVSGTLKVPVGRLRKMRMGNDYLSAFSVGDQLLWGAAEPLRRMLRMVSEF